MGWQRSLIWSLGPGSALVSGKEQRLSCRDFAVAFRAEATIGSRPSTWPWRSGDRSVCPFSGGGPVIDSDPRVAAWPLEGLVPIPWQAGGSAALPRHLRRPRKVSPHPVDSPTLAFVIGAGICSSAAGRSRTTGATAQVAEKATEATAGLPISDIRRSAFSPIKPG